MTEYQIQLTKYEIHLIKLTIGTFLHQNQNDTRLDKKKEELTELYTKFENWQGNILASKFVAPLVQEPTPKPPKLDFGGPTVDERMWRTIDDNIILISHFNYEKRLWESRKILENGAFECRVIDRQSFDICYTFTEDGDNQELGYLVRRKRGAEEGWPVVREVEG